MKWLIIAILLLPSGELNMIHNQELAFTDKHSCREYVMTNTDLLSHGINVYLNSMFGYNHEIKINGISCLDEETYNKGKDYDKEKKQMDDYLSDLVK
mgnify:CR=1 FL=1